MRLVSLRVMNYKCIDDSDVFHIDPVTCLVGKNEAGKTALLQAVHKLNPDVGDGVYDLLLEYPRRRRSDYQTALSRGDEPEEVIIAKWNLDDNEVKEIEASLGAGVIISPHVEVRKGYYDGTEWSVEVDESKVVAHFLSESTLDPNDLQRYESATSVDELFSVLESRDGSEDETQLLETLRSNFPDRSAISKVEMELLRLMPRFVYFDQYYQLPGRIAIEDIIERQREKKEDRRDRAFRALLGLVGQTAQGLLDIEASEQLFADLEAASASISSRIFEYWSQNDNLAVEFELDEGRTANPPPYNRGHVFETRIRNTRHKVTINFNERSQGFVWFFSFLVWFSQAQRLHGDRLILLLDEPGLGLHPKAQQDLLHYIRRELEPNYQVIYTAHSPFMVDPERLLSCRTVEDKVVKVGDREELLGTKVGDEVLSTDADTLSPLQGALGYEITQTLFVGKHSILVEGPSDLLYLKWFSERLREAKRPHLDPAWTVVPVGGISKVYPFVSLFAANALNIAVFVDLSHGEKGKVRELRESLLREGHMFTAADYVDGDEADTEDLLGRSCYFELVNRCYEIKKSHHLDPSKKAKHPRVEQEVREHLNVVLPTDAPPFNHYRPAEYLAEHGSELLETLPDIEAALDRFERLFSDLNGCLGGS